MSKEKLKPKKKKRGSLCLQPYRGSTEMCEYPEDNYRSCKIKGFCLTKLYATDLCVGSSPYRYTIPDWKAKGLSIGGRKTKFAP